MRTALAIATLLTTVSAPQQQAQPTVVLQRHFTAAAARYQYLAFDVAADVESMTLAYTISPDDGSSVIDFGLFEPGPLTLGTSSFRGYSGGAQRRITVGRSHASPGYRTGPLPTGTWHVMLGMYKVAPAGVDVQVSIAGAHDDTAADPPAPDRSPHQTAGQGARVGRERWYSGALHLHSTHSDGALGPDALAAAARDAGLDFMVVTDHNNTTHAREALPPAPLRIIGEEVTTPGGHASVWGLRPGEWIDFRIGPKDPGAAAAIDALVAQAHRAGALFALAHPIDNCAGCSWDQAIPEDIDAVEIWQNEKAPRDAEIAFWDRLLRAGRHVTAIGVSDWHRPPAPIGMAAVRVQADRLTEQSIVDGLRRGRVVVMRDATTAPPLATASCGSSKAGIGETLVCSTNDTLNVWVEAPPFRDGRVDFIWNAARMTSNPIGRGASFSMPAASGYLRAHCYAADGSPVAITNPIYVTTR